MNNLIDTIPFIGIRGDVLIETRDAASGKLAQRSEGHNLFTDYGLDWFFRSCASMIGGQFGGNVFFDENLESVVNLMNSNSLGFMKYLYLTDNESAVTSTMSQIPGTVTGYATRDSYTGTDTLRGSVNNNECIFSRSKLKAIFDFGTDKANGTHKSVFWADRTNTVFNPYWCLEDGGIEVKPVRSYYKLCESNDGYFYGTYNTTLYKIDPVTLEEIGVYTLPITVASDSIFDVVDGYCYCTATGSATALYVFKLSDSTYTTITLSAAASAWGGAVVDGYLYYPYSNNRIYKVNLSTGTSEYKGLSLPNSNMMVLRCGSQIYVMYYSNGYPIYSYDYATNILTVIPASAPAGTNCCNSHSLAGSLWYKQSGCYSYYNGSSNASIIILRKIILSKSPANMITGRVLDTPIEKNNTQTMKVTYTITFS